MLLPASIFIDSIQEGKIYYFSSNKIKSSVPHYFIVIKKYADTMLLTVCSTTQFESRKKFIDSRGLPYTTLVWTDPTHQNEFEKRSYFDCNSYIEYDVAELLEKYQNEDLIIKGVLEEHLVEQIRLGLNDSPLIEEEIKEIINS